ncbi:MAG: MoxR family ATPase [Ardenticatenales bacterium]|mgnify:CR=1 FL=1|jgi:MoxR-like ATPase|nr:MoxR family ATPase [Ardenticatenales bacterium]
MADPNPVPNDDAHDVAGATTARPWPSSPATDGGGLAGAPSPERTDDHGPVPPADRDRTSELRDLAAAVQRSGAFVEPLEAAIRRYVVGQDAMVERVLIALLADGHLLLEGVPGLAKTLLVKTVAGCLHADFSRVQFTPDLLPADLVGTQVYSPRTAEFSVHKGPLFANIVLADEINRAPAKVQSALLEAMQERQVTIGDETFPLPELFLVLATQNPIEQEGTYPLPEAQVDRFMLKVEVTYPQRSEERRVLDVMTGAALPPPVPVVQPADVLAARAVARRIYVDDKIKEYVLDLVWATRDPASAGLKDLAPLIDFGASPRAGIYLVAAARAHAFLRHRPYVTPDDVKALAPDVLRHRVIPSYEAEAEGVSGSAIVQRILERVDVP